MTAFHGYQKPVLIHIFHNTFLSLLVLVLAHYDQGSYITIYYWNTCLCSFVSSTLLKNEEQQSLFFAAPLLSHGGKVKFDCSHPCVQGRGCESTCRHIVLDGDWVTFLWGGVTERERLYFQQALSHWHETSRTINPLVWALFCLNSALCKFLDLRLVVCASQGLQSANQSKSKSRSKSKAYAAAQFSDASGGPWIWQ